GDSVGAPNSRCRPALPAPAAQALRRSRPRTRAVRTRDMAILRAKVDARTVWRRAPPQVARAAPEISPSTRNRRSSAVVAARAPSLRARDLALERRALGGRHHVEARDRARGLVGDLHLVAGHVHEALLAPEERLPLLRLRAGVRAARLELPPL